MEHNSLKTAVVVGGGLVGSLCACFLAKEGFKVDLYEQREDPRKSKLRGGRSINLALSNRGREAVRFVGLEELVLSKATPMKGRLVHFPSGKTKSILYDKHKHQCIYSVSRNYLNTVLLTASERNQNVKLHFNHRLSNINLHDETLTFQNKGGEINVTADIIVGADGAQSVIRRAMQQLPLFEFSQTYIDHGYIELNISPEKGVTMTPNHLHIWPRGTFMMIALPNGDDSWNVILFMPFEKFEALITRQQLLAFFEDVFTDGLELLGREELCDAFFQIKPSHLVSIKCSPYHYGKCVIIGDAAHAMVPFYGQGMNAGFEDCMILMDLLRRGNYNIPRILQEFSVTRREDAQAICELAMYNYIEMRDLVARRSFYARKAFDELLYSLIPSVWVPLYNSVTFSRMRYGKCKRNLQWQNEVIHKVITGITTVGILLCALLIYCII